MPARATPKAGRKKVRCPKCTALFTEPAKALFECPICECRLSAYGTAALGDNLPKHAEDGESAQIEATPLRESEQGNWEQSLEANSRVEVGAQQATRAQLPEAQRGASPTQTHNAEQGPVTRIQDLPCTDGNDGDTEGKPSVDDAAEDVHGDEAAAAKDSSSEESNLAVVEKETEGEDCVEQSRPTNKRLQLQTFQTTRCEFSFKYSLEGTSPLESDSLKRRLPSSKLSPSEITVPNTEESDVSLHAPLRVRIFNAREESSDQSEHGRYSFSSDTESRDGSESDFDFPAPWAYGLQDRVPPDSFCQDDELFLGHAKQLVSDAPHQLELLDIDEGTANDDKTIPRMEREEQLEDGIKTSSFDHSSPVADIAAKLMSSVAIDENQNLAENGIKQGLDCGREEEAGAFGILVKEASLKSSPSADKQVSNKVLQDDLVSPRMDQCDGTQEHKNAKNQELHKDLESLPRMGQCDGPQEYTNAKKQELHKDLESFPSANDHNIAIPSNQQELVSEISKGNSSSVPGSCIADGPMSSPSRNVDAYAELDARDKSMSDIEMDLYSHHEVDEWQYDKGGPPPSKANNHTFGHSRSSHQLNPQEMEGQASFFSDYTSNSVPLTNSQPFVFTNHCVSDHFSFGSPSSSHMYAYQVPAQPLIVPAAFQNHVVTPFGYHPVPNACMLCSHHQHSLVQAHFGPPCAVCLGHSGSITSKSGHADHWSCSSTPTFANSLVACTQAPVNLVQRYDFPSSDVRLQVSSFNKVSQYPPLPDHGAPPYFACKGCNRVLEVPSSLPPRNGIIQKLRCSACGRVAKFSDKLHSKQRRLVSCSPASEPSSMAGNASHGHNVLNPISSWLHEESPGQVLSQVDTNIYTAIRVSEPTIRGDYLEGKPRVTSIGTDSSYAEKAMGMISATSLRGKTLGSSDNARSERIRQDAVASLHVGVDEQDEGLDYGAPRISDGDSLDQIESRNRSPENVQAQAPGQVSELDSTIPGKKPGSPLLVLLNQESTRFMLSLDPNEEPGTAAWSPASDGMTPSRYPRKKRNVLQSHGSSMSRGPKYIAGLLRRSLKDLSKGGQ